MYPEILRIFSVLMKLTQAFYCLLQLVVAQAANGTFSSPTGFGEGSSTPVALVGGSGFVSKITVGDLLPATRLREAVSPSSITLVHARPHRPAVLSTAVSYPSALHASGGYLPEYEAWPLPSLPHMLFCLRGPSCGATQTGARLMHLSCCKLQAPSRTLS